MPLLATMSAWSPGQVVNTWEGDPYTSITGHKYAMMKFSFMRYYSDGTKRSSPALRPAVTPTTSTMWGTP